MYIWAKIYYFTTSDFLWYGGRRNRNFTTTNQEMLDKTVITGADRAHYTSIFAAQI